MTLNAFYQGRLKINLRLDSEIRFRLEPTMGLPPLPAALLSAPTFKDLQNVVSVTMLLQLNISSQKESHFSEMVTWQWTLDRRSHWFDHMLHSLERDDWIGLWNGLRRTQIQWQLGSILPGKVNSSNQQSTSPPKSACISLGTTGWKVRNISFLHPHKLTACLILQVPKISPAWCD